MATSNEISTNGTALETFSRPRYFYGQLLDVHHFDSALEYGTRKRWLINRLVSGYGVVCGLDVYVCRDGKSIAVGPGLALDPHGREIIVPARSRPVELPHPKTPEPPPDDYEQKPGDEHCEDEQWVHVCICFHECHSRPEPVYASPCDSTERCAPAAVEERYKIIIKDGKAPEIDLDCSIPEVVSGGRINYEALAVRVSRHCPAPPEDPCIPLANIRLPRPGEDCELGDIDISVRPIVYSNDLLFELILALLGEGTQRPRGGKY